MSSAVTWVLRQVDVTAWTMISSGGWPIFLCKHMTRRMVDGAAWEKVEAGAAGGGLWVWVVWVGRHGGVEWV